MRFSSIWNTKNQKNKICYIVKGLSDNAKKLDIKLLAMLCKFDSKKGKSWSKTHI